LGTLVNLSWRVAIVPCASVTTTQISVIERMEVVWNIVKTTPLVGIVNDVRTARMEMLQSNSVKVRAVPFRTL
jgi:hypothetical protein